MLRSLRVFFAVKAAVKGKLLVSEMWLQPLRQCSAQVRSATGFEMLKNSNSLNCKWQSTNHKPPPFLCKSGR